MKPTALICALTLWRCLTSAAETNYPESPQLFTLPSLDLRSEPARPQKPAEETILSEKSALLQAADLRFETHPADFANSESRPSWRDQYSIGTRLTELDMRVYRRLEEGGYLTRPEPETPIGHFMDRTFSPEIIHLGKGKAFAQCTLYTAIKRKNPLCLLNPIFIFVSW